MEQIAQIEEVEVIEEEPADGGSIVVEEADGGIVEEAEAIVVGEAVVEGDGLSMEQLGTTGHILDKHTCPICLKRFGAGGAYSVRRHMTMVHHKERPFPCPHCPYRALQRTDILRHLRLKHSSLLHHDMQEQQPAQTTTKRKKARTRGTGTERR
ncbi:zinc finger protein 64-like [Varroa jacobsoni]|uniref:C2H2-type domain-containing protein n=1 Tax=Varroa destructor TaxID=109461 RepID=A0A7M7KCC1_VARDE|nr:zinc finger protein 64-like [Varroa destructor]XP_022696363.1 zinc finger protein 64-like [Varroa jacobsoni]